MLTPPRTGGFALHIIVPVLASAMAPTLAAMPSLPPPGAAGDAPSPTRSHVAVSAGIAQAADGGTQVFVRLVHRPGVHTWPNEPVVPAELPGFQPIATELRVVELTGASAAAEAHTWPAGRAVIVHYGGTPLSIVAYTGTVEGKAAVTAAPGAAEIRGAVAVKYQPCDERYCYPPRTDTVQFRVPVP